MKIDLKLSKKKILIILLAFVSIYILWFFLNLLIFRTYKSLPTEADPLEIQGVYHLHTQFSDGRKSVDEIAKLASQADLDFIIITDHGSPNYESYASQGWKEGVLVLAGSELSVSRGHLVALGFNLPSRKLSQKAEHVAYEIE